MTETKSFGYWLPCGTQLHVHHQWMARLTGVVAPVKEA